MNSKLKDQHIDHESVNRKELHDFFNKSESWSKTQMSHLIMQPCSPGQPSWLSCTLLIGDLKFRCLLNVVSLNRGPNGQILVPIGLIRLRTAICPPGAININQIQPYMFIIIIPKELLKRAENVENYFHQDPDLVKSKELSLVLHPLFPNRMALILAKSSKYVIFVMHYFVIGRMQNRWRSTMLKTALSDWKSKS